MTEWWATSSRKTSVVVSSSLESVERFFRVLNLCSLCFVFWRIAGALIISELIKLAIDPEHISPDIFKNWKCTFPGRLKHDRSYFHRRVQQNICKTANTFLYYSLPKKTIK